MFSSNPSHSLLAASTVQRKFNVIMHSPLLSQGSPSYNHMPLLTKQQDEFLLYVESAGSLIYDFRRSDSVTAIVISLGSFFRSITGASASGTVVNLFTKLGEELADNLPVWQDSSWIDVLDDFHKNIHRVRECALGKKIIKVINHTVAHTFYYKMGVQFDDKLFAKFELQKPFISIWEVATFADAITGLLLFVAKAGRQCLLTGRADAFFVDSHTMADWVFRASEIRKNAEFLGNPSAVGLETTTYLYDLHTAIEEGNLLKQTLDDRSKMTINSIIVELKMVEKRYQCSLTSASFRFCPMGVFIYGDSGVGKSFISKGLFYHYCSVRGIPKEKAILYPRNSDDKYHSGYKSHMVGILFDDVAKHKPGKVMGIDISLTDIIATANNIASITNQAEVQDKGKIPMLSEWMGVTSNLKDLNVHQYFENSYAVLRRMPYRIEPVVKDAYRVPGETKLDSSLIPSGVLYPDCWTFKVSTVHKHDTNSLHGSYGEPFKEFTSYGDLLKWLTGIYQKHIDNQVRLIKTVNAVGPEELCECDLPTSLCCCDKVPGDIISTIEVGNISCPVAQSGDIESRMTGAINVLKGLNEEAVLFESSDPPPERADPAVVNSQRMMSAVEMRRIVVSKYKDLTGLHRIFKETLLANFVDPWMSGYVRGQDLDKPGVILHQFDEFMDDFELMGIRDKVCAISTRAGKEIFSDDDYLTFEPTIGGRRNFMRSQLRTVYDYILKYVKLANWDEDQLAALEIYVYDKVPHHLAYGWDDDSILKGAFDFVDKHKGTISDKKSSILLADLDHEPFWDRCARKIGLMYFTSPRFASCVNYVANTRVGSRIGRWVMSDSPVSKVTRLSDSAEAYNIRLMGHHPMVLIIVSVCASTLIVGIVSAALKYFIPQGQVRLEAMGKKPIVREKEKVNVWVTPERNLTRLDFDPRKPNSLSQMMPGIKHNSLAAQVYAQGFARANTKILVVNNTTFIMNNHCAFDTFQITVFYGKQLQTGLNPKFVVDVEPCMIRRIPERDLAIVTTNALPALFKDISCYFPKESFDHEAAAFYYVPNGRNCEEIAVIGIQRQEFHGFIGDRGGINMQAYVGKPISPTYAGDCGSPLIMHTSYGPVIVGIHCAYLAMSGTSYAAPIHHSDIEWKPMVQVGTVEPTTVLAQAEVVTLEEDKKLYTDFHQDGQLIVFGMLKGFRARPKANGGFTEIAQYLLTNGPSYGLSIVDRLSKPNMGSWKPQQNILKEYIHPTHSIKESLLSKATDAFIHHICSGLTEEDRADIHVVPLSVAVNGFPRVPNVDPLKFNTSGGHGYPGPKSAYVTTDALYEEWSRYREFDEGVIANVERIVDLAYKGIRSHPIFTAQLKDEMLSHAKVESCKTRGFYMCPLPFLIAMRMFTTGLTRVMVRRRDLFCNAIGLNTHSAEWDELYKLSDEIPGVFWMAGDFKGFDKILNILLQNFVKKLILAVCKFCGMSDEDVLALDTLLCDNVTAVVDFFGVLIMLLGGEVSGHQITAHFNSLANVLLHLYAWAVGLEQRNELTFENLLLFFSKVFIRVLGDDIMAKVDPKYDWYNHTHVQNVFRDIGIEYTMADKTSESRPFISNSEVTFLKRTFRFHDAVPGKMVAPLDVNSIFKMLVYTQPSRSVSPEVQLAQAIAAAYGEAFYHGYEFYTSIRTIVEDAPKSAELRARLDQYPPPTYQECISRYMTNEVKLGCATDPEELDLPIKIVTECDSYCHSPEPVAQSEWSMDYIGQITMGRSPEEPNKAGVRLSSKKQHKQKQTKRPAPDENKSLTDSFSTKQPTRAYGQMAPAPVEKAISKVLLNQRRRERDQKWRAVAQSEITPDTTGVTNVTQQTYSFRHEPTSKTVDLSSMTPDLARGMSMPQDLSGYLKRPILVHSFTWTEAMADGVQGSFNPWANFLSNGSVKEKLSGFGLVRGNLHVKFTVNGSPFYYGGMMANYTPLSGYRTDTISSLTNLALVQHSQKPHVWLNVQNTSTATMVLPFLYPYPFMETNLGNFNDMGRIDFVCFVPLKSANGVTGSAVDIQAFIWMEDVELSGPTNQPVAQSDIEYLPNGQISGPASAVAEAAGSLSSVPIIGPYAKATSDIANTVGKVASFFGFTNVPNVRDVEPMRQIPFELSSTAISAPVSKLSLQPKQEIALGAKQHGGGDEDELTISRFAGRQSFLVGSLWSTTAVPGDILFTSFASPLINQGDATAGQIVLPPVGYLSQLFQYWRGSLKFTFKMIRSKYHRGRIQIAWDRSANNLNKGAVLSNMNTFSTVLDLDEADEITVVVPYMQNRQFLQTSLMQGSNNRLWSTSATPPNFSLADYANGIINVRVLNRLTAPEQSSDVTMLVFVSAGDDIEFAAPRTAGGLTSATSMRTLSSLTTAVAQSDIVYEEQEMPVEHVPTPTSTPVYQEVFGEKVASVRELMHRSSLAKTYCFGTAGATGSIRYVFPIKHLPPSPGVWNNGNETFTVGGNSQFGNICPQHILPLIVACFVGYKGSVNVTANVRLTGGAALSGFVDKLSIVRVPDAGNLGSGLRRQYLSAVSNTGLGHNAYFQNTDSGALEGMALTNTRTNTSLCANLPYYNNSGFFVADLYKSYNNADVFSGANQDWWNIVVGVPQASTQGSNDNSLDVFYATGPDFDVIFFLNTPTIYTRAWAI